ncbi:MAG: T9SS type A sorting domain-containing protein, partial [Candidatus Marinimicrobia bacterium]|nr:T9SS type A sorting domain-containing protein [Candidatus Neomarinimicrobiota bacterium]
IWSIARDSVDIFADRKRTLRGDEEGLVALWHMDEPTGTGTAYDAAPNANDGTLQHDADFIYSIAPIVAGIPDISFPEDSLYTLDLDDYVTDANDDLSDLSWTVSSAGSGKCLSLKKKGNISSYLFLVPESKETFKGGFLKSNEQAKVNKPGRFGRIAQDDMEMRLSGEPTSSDKQERISNNLLFVPAKNETGRFSKSAKFTKGIKEDMEMKVSVKQTNVDSILITIDDITHVATFTATLNYNVSDVPFVFTATDPSGASDPDTMTVTVISLNDAPVFISALPDTSFDEDTVLKVPLSFWFEYVEDVDDSVETLVWSIEGNDNVFTEISSDTVIFSSLSDWYGIDTLTVIVSDLGELSDTTTLAVTVNAVNDAPLPFGLISPAADETIDSLIISFVWHESIDPDPEDVVSYAFRLFGPGVDTTITELPDTSLIFDGSNIFQYDTVYSWYVEATDDVEITTSEETFQFRTPVLVGVDIFSQIPEVFSLSQNFPNPFNPITKIGYGLPEDSRVDIVIYNLLGQEVRKLVSEYQMAGYRFSIWDGRDDNGSLVSTGVYIYVMTANEFHDVKKMVILK